MSKWWQLMDYLRWEQNENWDKMPKVLRLEARLRCKSWINQHLQYIHNQPAIDYFKSFFYENITLNSYGYAQKDLVVAALGALYKYEVYNGIDN